MSQIIPIYIPTLISDINYNPAKVYPRLFFYNGKVECQPYYFEHKTASGSAAIQTTEIGSFPYVDHYNVVTGSFPSADSKTLLFLNEEPVYGSAPSQSLYTEYWETYINLLYDPKTRLIDCSAIIPLADYYQMELNDLVEWRGNTYHLRAINEYDIKSGKCSLQLLGPIIRDAQSQQINCNFTFVSSNVATTTTTSTSTSTTTIAPSTTTTTTAAPFPCISASLQGALSGSFVSGGFAWDYLDFYPNSNITLTGSLNIYSGTVTDAKLLLIAGGGGGGYLDFGSGTDKGAGGGAGGVTYIDNFTLSSGSYLVTVGRGGTAGIGPTLSNTRGQNGFETNIDSLSVETFGGGGGGGTGNTYGVGASVTGGSGGGGCHNATPPNSGSSGAGGTPSVTGFAGGTSNHGGAGAGGGGAGGLGGNTSGTTGGNGGVGLSFTITGTTINVGGGGAGDGTGGSGTASFGGGTKVIGATNGSGGGGGSQNDGAPGRVVIAWKSCTQPTTTTTTTTGAPTTTTTTTAGPTTTTTTHSPNYYYVVQRYPCPTCSPVGGTQIGISSGPLTNGYFYGYPGSGECYQVQSEVATTSWSVDLNYMTGFPSCASYCST
jgi:hypothetical protein